MHHNLGLINNFTLGQDFYLRRSVESYELLFYEIYKFVWNIVDFGGLIIVDGLKCSLHKADVTITVLLFVDL